MNGDPDPNLGATQGPPTYDPATPLQAPRNARLHAVREHGNETRARPGNPPAPIRLAPGVAALLIEVERRIDANQRLDWVAGAPATRDPAERLTHLARLLVLIRDCIRHELPLRKALIAVAVQAVSWAAELEDET